MAVSRLDRSAARVFELFPVSSLGHTIIIAALIGGDWARNRNITADKSPLLVVRGRQGRGLPFLEAS
jgi:hypothetical protein